MHLISIEYQNMKESFINILYSVNELTRIDEIEWLKTVLTGVLVLDNWAKLIPEWEDSLGWILIWIIDLGTLLVLDRCRECEITSASFRVRLSWIRLMKIG